MSSFYEDCLLLNKGLRGPFVIAWLHLSIWTYVFDRDIDAASAMTILPLFAVVLVASWLMREDGSGLSDSRVKGRSSLILLVAISLVAVFINRWILTVALAVSSFEIIDLFLVRNAVYRQNWRAGVLLNQRLTIVGLGVYFVYTSLEPLVQHWDWPATHVRIVLSLLGYVTGARSGEISLPSGTHSIGYGVSLNHLDGYCVLLTVTMTMMIVCWFGERRWISVVKVAVLTLIYNAIYVAGIILIVVVDGGPFEMSAILPYRILAYLPLFLALGTVLSKRSGAVRQVDEGNAAGALRLCSVAIVLGLSLGFAVSHQDSGTIKNGRIAIDDSHSKWEWTELELNKSVYGVQTVYNYYWFRKTLQRYFPTVDVHRSGVLNDAELNRYDVWVFKTPTLPYSVDEVEAIHRFVRNGGGIYVIGDHTNIFGMNTYLNQLTRDLGIEFGMDAVCPRDSRMQYWKNTEPHPHPVTLHVRDFLWATSCSLKVNPLKADVAFAGSRLYSDRGEFTTNTFFGNMTRDPNERFGRFAQIAVARIGRGRVCAMSDSTPFSSFTMAIPGKPEMAVGSIAWLNRANRVRGLASIAFLSVIGSVVVLVVALRRNQFLMCGLGLILGSLCARCVCQVATRATYPYPDAQGNVTQVGFILDSRDRLPLEVEPTHDDVDTDYMQTFYVWLQRAGFFPTVVDARPNVLPHVDALVVMSSRAAVRHQGELHPYLLRGGKVVLMLTDDSGEDTALASFAKDLAIDVAATPLEEPPLAAAEASADPDAKVQKRIPTLSATSELLGLAQASVPYPRYSISSSSGRLIESDGAKLGLACQFEVGRGKLIVIASHRMFSNYALGSTSNLPTKNQLMLYDCEFAIFERVLGLARSK